MKRVLSYALSMFLVLSLLMIPNYEAQAANVSLSVSSSTVNVGDTVKVTVSVPDGTSATVDLVDWSNVLSFSSSSVDVGNNGGTITINLGKMSMANTNSVTVTFKANTSGSASVKANVISAVDNNTVENVELGGASTTITVANQTSGGDNSGGGSDEPQKSADNSLSSLKLSSGSLSPSFKKSTTKYTATVDYDVTKVVVSAKTSNANAVIESVTGDGNVDLEVGKNTIQIVVRAENGVKATYTIVVTRKSEAESTPDPSESESQSEEPEVNEVLQWNGEQLQAADSIPKEVVPESFESTLLVVNGQQMQGLSFAKADLKLVYLNNTNGAGSLYVYDEALETIYPFIKIESEKSYVMVLLPDEQNAPAPEGFESCTFSIEGKGLVSAYQIKGLESENVEDTEEVETTETTEESTTVWNLFAPEVFYAAEPKLSEYYLVYCMNNEGEKGWYLYDSVEETVQRYIDLPTVQSEEASGDIDEKYAELEKELKTAKMTQYIIIGVAAAVVLILVIVIIVLVVKNRKDDDDFFEEYEDDDDEYDDYEEVEQDEEEPANEVVINGMHIKEVVVDDVESMNTIANNKKDDDDDDGLEFIDFD